MDDLHTLVGKDVPLANWLRPGVLVRVEGLGETPGYVLCREGDDPYTIPRHVSELDLSREQPMTRKDSTC